MQWAENNDERGKNITNYQQIDITTRYILNLSAGKAN
jgi:hypothetical protein